MAKFYFLKTVMSKGQLRMRFLDKQKTESGKTISTFLNVKCDKLIRSKYPVGSIFYTAAFSEVGKYYDAPNVASMSVATKEVRDEYKKYQELVSSDESKSELPTPKTLYETLKRDVCKRPTIEDDGFFIKDEDWLILLRNIKQKVNTLMTGPTGSGKCLGKDTPILMYDGSIKMVQDVKVGDKLMGPDSQPRNVLSTTVGKEELFKIIPKKGDPWICNRSHILSLKRTNDKTSLSGSICNVSINEYLNWSKTHKHIYKQWRTSVEFEEKEIYLDPYFLGLWLGDGETDRPTICTSDNEIVNFIDNYAKELKCKMSTLLEPSKANSYSIVGIIPEGEKKDCRKRTNIQKLMDIYSLFGNKHIPKEYLYNSRSVRLKVFAGLIDSDGSNSKGCYDYTTKLESLKNDVVYLCRSLGYYVKISTKKIKEKSYWRLSISGNFDDVPVLLNRKKIIRKQKKDVLKTSFTIESQGLGDYYGFEIDRDKLFLLGDFTVTHNTSIIKLACDKLGIPLSVYDMGSMFDPVSGLLGVHRLQEGGVSIFDYAKFTDDIQKPGVILLDEISR